MHATKPLALAAVLLVAGTATADDKPADSKSLRIAAQKICPVRGTELGAHGEPVEVRVGKESVFLCCKGCLKGKISPEHPSSSHSTSSSRHTFSPGFHSHEPIRPARSASRSRSSRS